MEREVNQKLIEKLRNKEIWLHYGDLGSQGDLEGLRLVIKTAFPEDKNIPYGTARYYRNIANQWDATDLGPLGKETTHELEDFFVVDPVVHNYQIY